MSPKIPLAQPSIGDPEIAAAERALRSGRLVLGPENEAFERALAKRAGRAHAIAVSSGTTALELSLWALGIGPGDRVLIPSFGFAAAANATVRAGAEPVPVDVMPGTWTVDIESARAALDAGVRALVSIDQLGLVAEAAPLERFARDAGIALIDDAACGLGGLDQAGVAGGGFGVIGTFSFHPRKVITTGEGGAIVCDDADVATTLRQLRNQGQSGPGRFVIPGTNARLGEIASAVGRTQLERLDAMLAERRLLAQGYCQRLASLRQAGRLSWQQPPLPAMHTYQSFAVLLGEGRDRDAVRAHLAARDIESGPATYAFHRLGSFAGRDGVAGRPLPFADALHERSLALPHYLGMRSAELDHVCESLGEVLA